MHPAEGKAERTRVAGSSSHWGCQRAVPTPTSTSRSARLRVARRTPDAPSTPAQSPPAPTAPGCPRQQGPNHPTSGVVRPSPASGPAGP